MELLFLLSLVSLGLSSAQSAPDQSSGPVHAHRLLRSVRSQEQPGPDLALVRRRRFNSGWWEELQKGDLRRECVEEVCSYEEAREVFEHTETTNEFWKTYRVQDRCSSGPCSNGATCVDLGKDFTCLCPEGFSGLRCDLDDGAALRRCLVDNGGCAHFCEETEAGPKCSCADGYFLDQDHASCRSSGPGACGTVPVLQGVAPPPLDTRGRIVGGSECPRGECPWTVLLKNKGRVFCGAVFLNPDWVLTAAHCLEDVEQRHLQAVAGEHDLDMAEGSEQEVLVSALHVHERYDPRTADNDIALLQLASPFVVTSHAVPICLATSVHAHTQLLSVSTHLVSGWGRVHESGPTSRVMKRLQVPLVRSQACEDQTGLVLTQNMLCAGFLEGHQDSCKGDSGGPLVTRFRDTWFLTGLVSWGRGCARPGQYGIYTRVSRYLDWIRDRTGTGAKTRTENPGLNQNLDTIRDRTGNMTQGPEPTADPNQTSTLGPGRFQNDSAAEPGPVPVQTQIQNQTGPGSQ